MSRVLQTDAHCRRSGERSQRDAQDGHCAEELHGGGVIHALDRLLRGSRSEDEDWHGKRQVQHGEQHAAAADAERQRRADGAQQAEGDATDQDRQENAGQRGQRRAIGPRGERTHDGERRARQQPVRDGLRQQQAGEGLAGNRELLERAVVRVFAIEKLQREQRRQQRRDPHHAGRDDDELRFLGRDGQWEQRCDDREEDQRLHELARAAEREAQIAAEHEPRRQQRGGLRVAGSHDSRRRCAHDASTIR